MSEVYTFTIPGRLPGLNEIISQASTNRYGYGKFKKQHTNECAQWAMVAKIPKFNTSVDISVTWVEPNRRRDLDNISAGIKFILDGLVESGYLKNDTQEWVKSITHTFPSPDPKHPKIIVTISI